MAEKIQLLYGPSERIDTISPGEAGRVFFTVAPNEDGSVEGHIYFDNGIKIVELYADDLTNLESKISIIDATLKGLTGEDTGSIAELIEQAVKSLNLEDLYVNKYEFGSLPEGAYVSANGKEYRIFCKEDTTFPAQNSSTSNKDYDPSKYYISMKAYAPSSDIDGFKESTDKSITDDELYKFESNEFAGIDSYGRKYSIIWLPIATNNVYLGAKSTTDHLVGWNYTVEWYKGDTVVAADQIRINLTNEETRFGVLPSFLENYATKDEVKDQAFTWEKF